MVDAMADELSICPLAFQRRVLQIKNQTSRHNQHVEYVRSQFDRTFDTGLSDSNLTAIRSNIEDGYRDAGKIAKGIAENIGKL